MCVNVYMCVCVCMCICASVCVFECVNTRVGQNCMYAPYMTVYLVISQPSIPCIHRIYMVLANPSKYSVHAIQLLEPTVSSSIQTVYAYV